MKVLRFLSKSLGFFCLSLSLFLLFIVLFFFHLVATFSSLPDSLTGNASVFVEEHSDESIAFVQQSFDLGDVCTQDPSQEVCLMTRNTTFLSEQFIQLVPSESFDLNAYPEFHVIRGYVKHVVFVALFLFALGIVFIFLGYQPEYLSFFQGLSFFFFLEFLLYTLGIYFFLQLSPEQFVSLVSDFFPEISPFLVLFAVSLILPYFQSLFSDFFFPLLFLSGGFLLLFVGIFVYKKKNLS